MTRPDRLVVITGTGTEVGKTWVGAALARRLRSEYETVGRTVVARKPAQSYGPGERTDAEVLAEATGEDPETVCPRHRWYPIPMAPPMAAAALLQPVATIADLAGELDSSWPAQGAPLGIVEGAGGIASPLADDGDSAELARSISADLVVVVADPNLGVINNLLLTRHWLGDLPLIAHLNRYDGSDPLHAANRTWLIERAAFEVTSSIDELFRAVLA